MFHCTLGAKSVSLCGDMQGERISALVYRYGVPGRVELSFLADPAGGQHFSGTVSQLAPRASVRQLWFTRGGYTYLLSQCVGGSCPQSARLSVLRGEKIVSNRACLRSADDRAWFAPELARFGSDAASSQALTELIVFDEAEHGVERLYPMR